MAHSDHNVHNYLCWCQSIECRFVSCSGKWTDAEIDLLMSSVKRFSEDLNKISGTIKARTMLVVVIFAFNS